MLLQLAVITGGVVHIDKAVRVTVEASTGANSIVAYCVDGRFPPVEQFKKTVKVLPPTTSCHSLACEHSW